MNQASSTHTRRTSVGLVLAGLPAIALHDVVQRASALAPAAPGYWEPSHLWLLYLLVPLATASAAVLFLAPGLILVRALEPPEAMPVWLIRGYAVSLVLVSGAAAAVTAFAGPPVIGATFGLLVLLLSVASLVVTWRHVPGASPQPSVTHGRSAVWLALLVPVALYLVLSPKFLWESLNGDGAHAFEASRLLVRQALPFWPPSAGAVAGFPGWTSMLFTLPNGWFLRLFGEVVAAARLPFLLHLAMLGLAIEAVGSVATREGQWWWRAGVWLGLVAYVLAMAFSATYNPYSADIALPATQDTLLMVCLLAFVHAWWTGARWWAALFAWLTCLSLPSGLVLLGFFLLAEVAVRQPHRWRSALHLTGLLVAAVAATAVLGRIALAAGANPAGGEYGLVGILRYFAFLQFTDWTRLVFVAVGGGLFPAAMLFLWRRQDVEGRILTLVSAAYFLFFFVQAHVSLHHFVPAMVLPMAVAWRVVASDRGDVPPLRWRGAWMGLATLAVVASFPRHWQIHTDGQEVGSRLAVVGDYANSDPALFNRSTLLARLFPYDWDPVVPAASYGGSPLVWNHYARHGPADSTTNYVLQATDAPAPAGMHLVARDSVATLYVRSDSIWLADQARRPPTPAGSPVYFLPRGILFRSVPRSGGPVVIDVVAQLEKRGVDMTAILARLGVQRK